MFTGEAMRHRTSRYFDLSIPAPVRLSLMKSAFETHAQDYPHCPESARPKSWRDVRARHIRTYERTQRTWTRDSTAKAVAGFLYGTATQGRSSVAKNSCMSAKNSTGTIPDGTQTTKGGTLRTGQDLLRGIVGRLTHGRLIAGYWWGDNGERVYFPEVYSDMADAVKAAEGHARVFAESAQEDRKQDELREAEEKVAETLNKKVELIARMKEAAACVMTSASPTCANATVSCA